MVQFVAHYIGRYTLAWVKIFVPLLFKGPSEQQRVGSSDVAMSEALIGSQMFCRKVSAAHCENPATVPGLFGKKVQQLLLQTNSIVLCLCLVNDRTQREVDERLLFATLSPDALGRRRSAAIASAAVCYIKIYSQTA